MLAEDTRRTRKLLSYFDIHTKILSYRAHNKVYQGRKLLTLLQEGNTVAVCSDAGMPLISDPGEDFVRLCIEKRRAGNSNPWGQRGSLGFGAVGIFRPKFPLPGIPPPPAGKNSPVFGVDCRSATHPGLL